MDSYHELLFSARHINSVFFSSLLMIFVTSPVRMVDAHSRQRELEEALKSHRLEAELRFLQAQVNPHFLFNTLNNIYSLAFTGSAQTAPMIMKLSEMMRYMVYDGKAAWVPLRSEIQYIYNYIELQQLKTPERQQIRLEVSGDPGPHRIPPLLFVPLFENAFKHGNLDAHGQGWLEAHLDLDPQGLHFSLRNTFLPRESKDQIGGIGLDNIRQRLALIFPGRHAFEVLQADGIFEVAIRLTGTTEALHHTTAPAHELPHRR
ncbi:MAG: hypothetical protein OHK0039_05310 [Bacteroidia bacterium]